MSFVKGLSAPQHEHRLACFDFSMWRNIHGFLKIEQPTFCCCESHIRLQCAIL